MSGLLDKFTARTWGSQAGSAHANEGFALAKLHWSSASSLKLPAEPAWRSRRRDLSSDALTVAREFAAASASLSCVLANFPFDGIEQAQELSVAMKRETVNGRAKNLRGLTSHQILAVRRAYPEARINGPVVRVGRWTMVLLGESLDLPVTEGPTGWHTDGSDEAMIIWTRVRKVLGG